MSYLYLSQNQEKIQEYCEIANNLLGIDVAVVDKRLIRIAGTGRCKINQFLNINGKIQKRAIETKNMVVVHRPREDFFCLECNQKDYCEEKMEICAPIINEGDILGAISFICFDDEVRLRIRDNLNEYCNYLENMSQIISNYVGKLCFFDKENIKDKTSSTDIITFSHLAGNSKKYLDVINRAKLIAPNDATVLITGESGTGKELLAKAIHHASRRREGIFVAINCGAIPENLLESELFGYVEGAFTGASKKGKIGKFQYANNGTIFLDEINEMPLFLQTKLLRFLQERTIERVGSNAVIPLDVRVIAATNKDIKAAVGKGEFREDLFYRLHVIPLSLPSLRERKDDIVPLMNHFMTKHSAIINTRGVPDFKVSREVFEIFKKYTWPGNVRELENVVIHMLNLMNEAGEITKESLPEYILTEINNQSIDNKVDFSDVISLEEIEKKVIKKALKLYGDSTLGKKNAARQLGISLTTLYRKIYLYRLE
ncbi:MAG: sigma 54-interacting transcriptional regulator [Dethiobacter sp.]|jgi:transcriptional regulator with PAS, ATPase and Fis domain|nr:sigma 54-interacting transcriptional regulator [Dethiobacter sp.]